MPTIRFVASGSTKKPRRTHLTALALAVLVLQVGTTGSVGGPAAPACSDGIDNDGDGRIDSNDPDCGGPSDDHEETAPVTLLPGDIAIIQYRNDDTEGFGFVTFVGLAPHTQIVFTDHGWSGLSLTRDEHTWIWNSPASTLSAGTVVNFSGATCTSGFFSAANDTIGISATISGLSGDGDQIIAYQGSPLEPVFLYALSTTPFKSALEDIDNNTTQLPIGLINGVTAHDFGLHLDNGYLTPAVLNGSREALIAQIGSDASWTTANSSGTPFRPPAYWNFTVQASTAPRISVAASSTPLIKPPLVVGVVGGDGDPAAVAGIDFNVADPNTPPEQLVVTATSSEPAVVAPSGLNVQRVGGIWNLTIASTAVGTSNITVTASDGASTHSYPMLYMALPAPAPGSHKHRGIADASSVIAIDDDYMLVAGDERVAYWDGLFLYPRRQSSYWIDEVNIGARTFRIWIPFFTDLPRELDFEAGLRVGNQTWWIGSSSNSEDGECRYPRHGLYSLELGPAAPGDINVAGFSHREDIRSEFISWDQDNLHGLGSDHYGFWRNALCGADLPPLLDPPPPAPPCCPTEWIAKRIDGFNIEGLELAPGSNGEVALVGFRAPIVPHTASGGTQRNRALLVPMGLATSGTLTFGTPIELDLDGRGVRSISRNSQGEYLLIAGSYGEHGPPPDDFRLYRWTGRDPDLTAHPADFPVPQSVDLAALRDGTGSFEGIVEVASPLECSTVHLVVDDGVGFKLPDLPGSHDDLLVRLLDTELKLLQPLIQNFRSFDQIPLDCDVCFATADDGVTVYGSHDAQAIQNAVRSVGSAGGVIKVAGSCEGASVDVGRGANGQYNGVKRHLEAPVEVEDLSVTLIGGFRRDDWTISDPASNYTRIAAGNASFAFDAVGTAQVVIQDIDIEGEIRVGPEASVTIGHIPQAPSCRFASSVVGFSSQYGSDGWSASRALGPPDVYPAYGDLHDAWASLTADDQPEFLVLGFDSAAPINFVNVYETYAPGAIQAISVKHPATGLFVVVWTGTAGPTPPVSRMFTATFPRTSFPVSEVRIDFDSPAVPDWNEIDAVAIGFADLDAESQWASSVVAFSSQYDAFSYGAAQVLGPPDVFPFYGDAGYTWASLTADDQPEFLELAFASPAAINFVRVVETFSPGALNKVSVKNPGSGVFEEVWSGIASPAPPVARILTVSFPETRFPVSEVRLDFDSPAVPTWNEVDAVAIGRVGCGTDVVVDVSPPATMQVDRIQMAGPNPFTQTAAFGVYLSHEGRVRIEVFNVLGQRVTSLVDQVMAAGRHEARWDGRDAGGNRVANGIYFVRLESPGFRSTLKLVKIE